MRITIAAMGRLRSGPEKALVDDYLSRATKAGRALALGPFDIAEGDERKGGERAAEAALLRRLIPDGALVVALDERGQTRSSPNFADMLADWRDGGRRDACFLIGGADGLDPVLAAEAHFKLSLGPMVWPHMLARVMLAEQLYRAVSIQAGTPYHRA